MNKFIFFSVLISLSVLFAQQKFNAKVIPTVIDPSFDCWHKSVNKDAFAIPAVKKVVPGQKFRLCVLFSNYGTKDNNADVKFWIKCTKPDGTERFSKNKLTGLSNSGTGKKQISESIESISFNENDPTGKYKFQVLCIDYINKKKLKRTFEIELMKWQRGNYPGSLQEYSQWMHNYYKNPAPNQAIQAFLTHFVPVDKNKQFSYHILHFFSTVFTKNEHLIDLALRNFSSYTTAEKIKIATLYNAINKTDKVLALCDESERQIISKTKIPLFDPYTDISNPVQVSMLWLEFYATGTIAPIKKIVDTLKNSIHYGAKKKHEKSPKGHEQEILKDILFQVTAWSLQQNWRMVPLVTSYSHHILKENKNSQEISIRTLHQMLYNKQQKK
ncbi:hypothetical protein [Candidatus Uabimicrobium sp. HlEnr_7]|uniref:hypothetical protein n=1 Tax=Candidatus Uabimicrobium helgolandensis TaxID=3095367 RepID=UPI0035593347